MKNKDEAEYSERNTIKDEQLQIKSGEGILSYEIAKLRISNGCCPHCNIHMDRHGTACGEQNAKVKFGTILQTPLGNGYPTITDQQISEQLLSELEPNQTEAISKTTPSISQELIEAAEPLVKLLRKTWNPHVSVIVTNTGAEVVEGILTTGKAFWIPIANA